MDTFAYRLMLDVIWRNSNNNIPTDNVREYLNNLWDKMSTKEQDAVALAVN